MKIFFCFSAYTTALLFLTGCNKDEENKITGSLTATWKMTDLHADDGVSTTTLGGQTITSSYTIRGLDYHASTTFTENPNEFNSTGSYQAITNIQLLGSDTTTVYVLAGGTWSISGQTLKQVDNGDTTTFEILELTDSKLRLKENMEEMYSDTSFGLTVHKMATVYSSFEKE